METFSIPTEVEIKKWITEAVQECLGMKQSVINTGDPNEPLLNRQEAAALLRISTVTLTDWTKRGLPHYRQRGRIYYTRAEIIEYLKTNFPDRLKFSDRYAGFNSA
jgi:hypothetical protein